MLLIHFNTGPQAPTIHTDKLAELRQHLVRVSGTVFVVLFENALIVFHRNSEILHLIAAMCAIVKPLHSQKSERTCHARR